MKKESALLVAVLAAAASHAQQPQAPQQEPVPQPASLGMLVYPGQNQDAAHQNKDEVECYNCLYVHHTDAEREWAYDRTSSIGRLDKGLVEAKARGWLVVSIKDDWKRVFSYESE